MIGGFLLFGLNGSQCNQHAKGDKRKSGQDNITSETAKALSC